MNEQMLRTFPCLSCGRSQQGQTGRRDKSRILYCQLPPGNWEKRKSRALILPEMMETDQAMVAGSYRYHQRGSALSHVWFWDVIWAVEGGGRDVMRWRWPAEGRMSESCRLIRERRRNGALYIPTSPTVLHLRNEGGCGDLRQR